MKFENLKEGDNVLVEESVIYDHFCKKTFWILKPVESVNDSQFKVNNRIYNKKDGKMVGPDHLPYAYYPGDKYIEFGKEHVAVDQTDDMNKFIIKLNMCKFINESLLRHNVYLENQNLEKIYKNIREAIDLIEDHNGLQNKETIK